MFNPKSEEMAANLQNPTVAAFLLQFHFLCGELEGFDVIGQVLPASRPILEAARKAVISRIKAVMEAFCWKARQTLGKDPEEVPAWQLAIELFKDRLEGIDQVEAHPEVLAGLLLNEDLIPGPGALH